MKSIAQSTEYEYSPGARATAAEMERAGYVQADHSDLDDQEDVMLLDGRNGNVAPARHHKFGPLEDTGRRERHVFEVYPGSPHAKTMPLRHAVAESQEGGPIHRMGIFRLTAPEHALHGEAMYASREARHREA